MCESVGKADLLSDHFDSNSPGRLLICHSHSNHLLVLSPLPLVKRGQASVRLGPLWTDPLDMFPLFLKRTVYVMAPCLSVVFRQLVRLGSFPACWRQANVTPNPKGPPPSPVSNY